VALYAVPGIVAITVAVAGASLTEVIDALLGGYALAAGVLIAVFTQLAGWRAQLDGRRQKRPFSEAPARRALHAAVAHSLVGVIACVLAVPVSVFVKLELAPLSLWNSLAAGFGAYVLGLLWVIVRSAFIGYMCIIDSDGREEDEALTDPETYTETRFR